MRTLDNLCKLLRTSGQRFWSLMSSQWEILNSRLTSWWHAEARERERVQAEILSSIEDQKERVDRVRFALKGSLAALRTQVRAESNNHGNQS
jgi:hypothetical protein